MGDRLADAVIARRKAGGAPGGDQRAPFREAFDNRDHQVEQKFFVGRAGIVVEEQLIGHAVRQPSDTGTQLAARMGKNPGLALAVNSFCMSASHRGSI